MQYTHFIKIFPYKLNDKRIEINHRIFAHLIRMDIRRAKDNYIKKSIFLLDFYILNKYWKNYFKS